MTVRERSVKQHLQAIIKYSKCGRSQILTISTNPSAALYYVSDWLLRVPGERFAAKEDLEDQHGERKPVVRLVARSEDGVLAEFQELGSGILGGEDGTQKRTS
jgi:hypothetical protein